MGKIKQSPMGGISGTIGNLIGSSWKGIPYLRTRPAVYHDANTPSQSRVRSRFGACSKLSKSLKTTIIRPVWDNKAQQMSGHNLFISKNVSAFDKDGNITSYEGLTFTLGDLPLPADLSARANPELSGEILLTWTDNSGEETARPTDQLKVIAMSEGELTLCKELADTRSSGTAKVRLPYTAGATAHLYIYFVNEKNTLYSPDKHTALTI